MRPLHLLPLLLAAAIAGCAEDDYEERVPLEQTPAAVRATLERETRGAAITEVEREEEDGQTVYEAKATVDGKRYEFAVAADGTLVSKEEDDD